AAVSGNYTYFNPVCAEHAEAWQIISPVRALTHGVTEVNRLVHRQFRSSKIELARRRGWDRKVPQPMGNEEIVYGDKVINVTNKKRDKDWKGHSLVYPREDAICYVANGEIGMVVGQFKTPRMKFMPKHLEVAFSSQ